jgi:putative ABC transport system substrate-binding protein
MLPPEREMNMRRREFLGLVGGAAAWPLAARAQQATMPVIGFLRGSAATGSEYLVAAFNKGLNDAALIEGRNFAIEYRWADDHPDRLPELAADLVGRPVALVVGNAEAALAAKAATTAIPIVFVTGGDPVREGLVLRLNRPEGNVTGVVFFLAVLGAKRLELLRQLAPSLKTVAMLVNPNAPNTEAERKDVLAAASAIGQQLFILEVSSVGDIAAAFATLVQREAGALLVGSGAFLNSHRERVAALAARYAIPAIYAQREAVIGGGLVSYGPSITEAYRHAGNYAGRILKGDKPGDLPVMQSTKFDFVINLKTAKKLGLEIHPQLLATADEVIE